MKDAEDWLADRLSHFAKLGEDFEPRTLADPNNKWLVKSALQKAIRRGHTGIALNMAAYVFGEDDKDCFRALAVMIVEDIGPFGPPGLIAASVCSTLTAVRKQFGPAQLYGGMVRAASDSDVKTRACCELGLGVECQEGWDLLAKTFAEGPLLAAWLETPSSLDDMVRSYVSGVELRKRCRHGNDALMERCLRVIMLKEAEETAVIDLMHSFERSVDGMSIAAWPVHQAISNQGEVEVRNDIFSPNPSLIRGGLPNYAYDMHTRPGKLALKALHTQLSKEHDEIAAIPKDKAGGILGACLFVVEGGLINNRLRSSLLADLKGYQDYNFIESRGLPRDQIDTVLGIMESNMHVMDEKRIWADGLNK